MTLSAALLGGVLAVLVALNVAYVVLDTTPQHWDPSNHVMHSMRIARSVTDWDPVSLVRAWTTEYVFYPPGFFVLTAPAFVLFGCHIDAGILWQLLYVGLTMCGIYMLLSKNGHAMAGVLGAAIYMGFPIVLGFSRMTYIENLLALEVIAVLLLVVEARPFRRRLRGLGLGVLLGLGQMTKWNFAFYVAPLLLIALVHDLLRMRRAHPSRRELFRCVSALAAVFAGTALVAAPWYLSNLTQLLSDVKYHAYVKNMGDPPLTSPESMLYYIQAFPWQMIGIPLSVALVTSLIDGMRRSPNTKIPMLVASFLLSLLLLSFSKHKEGRFLLPMLPYAAVLIAWNVARVRTRPLRVAAVWLLVAVSSLNCVGQTFGSLGLLKEAHVPIGLGRRGYFLRFGTPEWIMLPIRRDNWGLEDMFEQIVRSSAQENIEPTVAWVLKDDHRYYNPNTIFSYVYAYGKKVDHHKRANYWVCRLAADKFYRDGDVDAERRVHQIGRWPLPDGSEARLYRCYPDIRPLSVPLVLKHNASDHYFPGFYDAESDFRWSKGVDARIDLPISELSDQAGTFEVTILMSGLGDQRTSISFNGAKAWSGLVSAEPATYSFGIDRTQIHTSTVNVMRFRLPDARVPSGRDTRLLGLALREMTILPVKPER
ncbi:ArnT family glycosyltransferase [Verrucomicrobiota bacterium]